MRVELHEPVVTKNEIADNFHKISQFTRDNFFALWVGAKRLHSKGEEDLQLIPEDYWALRRIQYGNVRFHQSQGVKRTSNLNHKGWENEDITDEDILEAYDKIIRLLNEAETPVKSTLEVTIK